MTAITAAAQTRTLDAIHTHHAQLETAVAAGAVAVRDAAERLADVTPHRAALVELLQSQVLPHALAEERTLYDVGAGLPATGLLVEAMTAEHRRLQALVSDLAQARTSVAMAGTAMAVRALFEAHLAKENDQLLPALVAGGVDLAQLLDGMHEILGEAEAGAEAGEHGCGCGSCGCGESGGESGGDSAEQGSVQAGDLDVRPLPPALRHEKIFAMVALLAPGDSFVLANDHDPKPLRYQLDAEQPGQISWQYLDQGPTLWRVQIGRAA